MATPDDLHFKLLSQMEFKRNADKKPPLPNITESLVCYAKCISCKRSSPPCDSHEELYNAALGRWGWVSEADWAGRMYCEDCAPRMVREQLDFELRWARHYYAKARQARALDLPGTAMRLEQSWDDALSRALYYAERIDTLHRDWVQGLMLAHPSEVSHGNA